MADVLPRSRNRRYATVATGVGGRVMDALKSALAVLPEGWSITIQQGDDWGGYTHRWYAISENTVELPDAPTGRLGVGSSPDEALYDLAEQLSRITALIHP